MRCGSHATIVEQRESDTTERLSHHPRIDSSLNTSAGEKGLSNDAGPNRPSYVVERSSSDDVVPERSSSAIGSLPDTPMVGPGGSHEDIELQMLASTAARMLSNPATSGRVSISSDPFESSPEAQVDPKLPPGTGPTSPRIRTRVEPRLRFAEE